MRPKKDIARQLTESSKAGFIIANNVGVLGVIYKLVSCNGRTAVEDDVVRDAILHDWRRPSCATFCVPGSEIGRQHGSPERNLLSVGDGAVNMNTRKMSLELSGTITELVAGIQSFTIQRACQKLSAGIAL